MKLEVGEFCLSANGNITKIIECTDCEELQDEYNYKSNDDEYYGIAKYKDSRFVVEYENVEECLYEGNFEVIGIQE